MSWSPSRKTKSASPETPRCGVARALSKLGICSRNQAAELAQSGRVRVNGTVRKDPEFPVRLGRDTLTIDGEPARKQGRVYLMLNKPRGLVTTASDEKGRRTVFECLSGQGLPHLGPVGRLDQASEGLLLFTNDTVWSDRITDPKTHLQKCYHVQVNHLYHPDWKSRAESGVRVDGESLRAAHLDLVRQGEKNCWLSIILDEGRNRQIRRLLSGLELEVLRLVRISIGSLQLGQLKKGQFRHLTTHEVRELSDPGHP